MDMGSSSLPASVVCGSNDSLNGLKFGKKIYFEDVNGGASSSKASPGSGSTPMPASVKKGKGVVQGAQQPPRCQVEGCNVDLSDAKPYYSRHKVCGMHSKSPKVIVAGLEQRFCQQCSRFHQLPEFDQGKRSCRRRLAGHNERRRKPHPGSLSSRIGRLSSSFHEDNSRFRSFMMDFTHPREAASARDIWPTVRAGDRASGSRWQAGLNGLNSGIAHHGFHPYMQGSTGGTVLSNLDILPHRSAGVSDSSCALSLLSNYQPWSSNTSRSRALTLSASSSIGGALAQSIFANGYATSSWEFKGHEPSGGSQGLYHDMEMAHVAEQDNGQFSGELELALQDNQQDMNLNPTRAYGHAEDATQWSL